MVRGTSLSQIGATVSEQLKLLDLIAGEEFLTGVTRIVEPLREKLNSSRTAFCDLTAEAGEAADTAQLSRINDDIVKTASELFLAIPSVPAVHELCTDVRGAIAERALELARQELYFSGTYCDLPLALLAVGSDGRREQSLAADQDYLFLYGAEDIHFSHSEEKCADYFGILGSVFAAKMEEAGISRCSGGIMPLNQEWRGTMPEWQQRLTGMFRFEKKDWNQTILTLIALMDARYICGDRELGLGFGTMVRTLVRENSAAIRNMARVVSSMRLSKGFLRRFIVEAEGKHEGEFNLKLLAWMPLVMGIRLMAVYHGIEDTSTLERIKLLDRAGFLPDRMAAELTEAYHSITGNRITQQIKKMNRIIDDDCYINPFELKSVEREKLRKAIGTTEELQGIIRKRFWIAKEVDDLIRT